MQLKKLERDDLASLMKYFKNQNTHICNYTAGSLFMWGKYNSTHYAE